MIPFLPTLNWWSIHMECLRNGEDVESALASANRLCGVTGKEFVRGDIEGGQLALPLEGGASVSKRLRSHSEMDNLILSDHGKWRREHLGALAAAYGRTPFFIHFYPELEKFYTLSEENISAKTFILNLYNLTLQWINDYALLQNESLHSEAVRLRMEEMKRKVNREISIFDAIFRFGKETALCL